MFATAISLKMQNNNDDKLKSCVLRGLLHHFIRALNDEKWHPLLAAGAIFASGIIEKIGLITTAAQQDHNGQLLGGCCCTYSYTYASVDKYTTFMDNVVRK